MAHPNIQLVQSLKSQSFFLSLYTTTPPITVLLYDNDHTYCTPSTVYSRCCHNTLLHRSWKKSSASVLRQSSITVCRLSSSESGMGRSVGKPHSTKHYTLPQVIKRVRGGGVRGARGAGCGGGAGPAAASAARDAVSPPACSARRAPVAP